MMELIDFYLPKENVLIEVDGEFHRPGESHLTKEQMENYDMLERERLDRIKTQYAKDQGIYLIRLPYYSQQKQKGIEKMIHELEVKLHGDQEKSR